MFTGLPLCVSDIGRSMRERENDEGVVGSVLIKLKKTYKQTQNHDSTLYSHMLWQGFLLYIALQHKASIARPCR